MDLKYFECALDCFFLTIVLEPLFFSCFGFNTRKFVLFSFLLNIGTNLVINIVMFFAYRNGNIDPNIAFGISELIVLLIEILAYFFTFKKDFLLIPLAFSANALTILLGILISYAELL